PSEITRAITGGDGLLLRLGVLRQAEPVAAAVNEDRLNAIGILGWRRRELNAAAFQFFVGGATIVGVEDAATHQASVEQRAQMPNGFLVELAEDHRLVEHQFQVGLVLWADGEPAKAAFHREVGANLEAKLVPVEVERLVVVEHKDSR